MTGMPGEIDEAIELVSTAVAMVPQDHPELGAMLNNPANSLLMRFRLRGDRADLHWSVDLLRRSAVSMAPSNSQRPTVLAALATALRTRFQADGSVRPG